MPKLTGSAAILLVADVEKSANYFRDQVGFSYDRFWGDPPGFCILKRDGYHLMLCRVEDPGQIRPHWKIVNNMWNVYFWVDNVDELYQELIQRGAKIDYHLGNKDYGCREFGIQDLDGHDIAFGQIIE